LLDRLPVNDPHAAPHPGTLFTAHYSLPTAH
jgi:hypothetical protein